MPTVAALPEGLTDLQIVAGPVHLPGQYVPVTPTTKQEWFLRQDALEAFFGGSAGPGKSWALLMSALQYVDVPGYHGLLLRPALTEFEQPGGLIPISHDWLGGTNAFWHGGRREWKFPSGASIRFGYLASISDARIYKGPSYSFCVSGGTGIRMADGSTKLVEEVEAGDMVMTLEGPRPVTKTHRPGLKRCVRVTTPQGSSVVSAEHKILTGDGWASPQALMSNSYQRDEPTNEVSQGRHLGRRRLVVSIPSGLRRERRLVQRSLSTVMTPVTAALPRGAGIDSAESGGGHRGAQLRPQSTCQLVLHVPAPQQDLQDVSLAFPGRVHGRAMAACGRPGSESGYPMSDGCGGGRPPTVPVGGRARTPSPDALGGRTRSSSRWDDQASIPSGRSHAGELVGLTHPYTNATLDVREAVQMREARMDPAGEAEVFDLTVAGASHYITDAGIVSANCGFDELTSFPEHLYRAMFRVLRQAKGGTLTQVPLRMRSASNPGDIGHHWVKARFVTDETRAKDAVYIPALIQDNPFLDYDAYLQSLEHLSPVDRERLINGDWDVMEEGGAFKRDDFRQIDPDQAEAPAAAVRYWDLAATEPSQSNPDPDWTVGLKLERSASGRFCIRDIVRGRWTADRVEVMVRQTAEEDGRSVPVYIEQEPGASGKTVISHFQRKVLAGFPCYKGMPRQMGNKEVRARPVSAAVANGLVDLVRGKNFVELLDECAIFPNGPHDDIVDALSGAHTYLTKRPDATGRRTSVTRARIPGVGVRPT